MGLSAVQSLKIWSTIQALENAAHPGEQPKPPAEIEDFADVVRVVAGVSRRKVPFDWTIVDRRMNEIYDAMQEPFPREKFRTMLKEVEMPAIQRASAGLETVVANVCIGHLVSPAANPEAVWRSECAENMQRLLLAILLYQLENGKMPDAENWTTQIKQYLGENAERYFSCPSNPSPEGHTTYALVQYGDTVVGSHELILLVELSEAVPLAKAVISVDEVLARQRTGSAHSGGMNVAYRSGAVRFLSSSTGEKELLRMLGREEEKTQEEAQE